jgi:hypothetical protein
MLFAPPAIKNIVRSARSAKLPGAVFALLAAFGIRRLELLDYWQDRDVSEVRGGVR